MTKKKSQSEYELIPVKPLQDLRKEIQQLKRAVTEEHSFQKILVKHMNLDVQLQKDLREAIDRINRTNQRMDKLISAYENTSRDDLITSQNIRHEERHQELLKNFAELQKAGKTSNRERPRFEPRELKGRKIVYRRTKKL